ncbi:hypothetical protein BT63DRAFT_458982 [Microthyrium microscopicum]|uniref:Uncharacterized protein n=1 Tax=Microthyrium microscopicum TaxID=703497 RepID=A0A6A6U177_9PEZI|nr:hypothetical protein BT63DRAFT_458982 [Microthyrium microscopicum]
MGARLSRPPGVDGMSEAPITGSRPRAKPFNARLLGAPIAAFSMACILFAYTRTSIHAAKLHVEKRREEGGGQIDWGLENKRNHGQVDSISDATVVKEAVFGERK